MKPMCGRWYRARHPVDGWVRVCRCGKERRIVAHLLPSGGRWEGEVIRIGRRDVLRCGPATKAKTKDCMEQALDMMVGRTRCGGQIQFFKQRSVGLAGLDVDKALQTVKHYCNACARAQDPYHGAKHHAECVARGNEMRKMLEDA